MKTRKIVTAAHDKNACVIQGVCVTAAITSNKKCFDPAGCAIAVPVPLLLEHDQSIGPIGEVFQIRKSETEVSVRAALYQDRFGYAAWLLIKDGQLTGLSIGVGSGRGDFHITEINGVDCFTRFRIAEVSLCFKPSNAECRFRVDPSGAQKMIDPTITKARELLRQKPAWEVPKSRPKSRPLSEDDPRLAKMHPDSRRLLLELRRKKGV